MKEVPALSDPTSELIRSFTSRISRRKPYYTQFKMILHQQFSHIIQQSINKCISCGKCFLGKSIGPHYKKSKQCYLKKCAARQPTSDSQRCTNYKEKTGPPSQPQNREQRKQEVEESVKEEQCQRQEREYSGGLFYQSQDQSSSINLDQFLIAN